MIGSVGFVSTWFERRAGSEETLLALYDAVQAAEEADLAEQARDEAAWTELRVLYDWPSDGETTADSFNDTDPDADGRITMSQAIGIVEHLLGGQSVP
jgi:hypothetical protein